MLLSVACVCACFVLMAYAQGVRDLIPVSLEPRLTRELIALQRRALPPDDRSSRMRFDFIVVGAGPAGCALARRLTEVPRWSVLLLEAGGEEAPVMTIPFFAPVLSSTDVDWNYTTVPQQTSCTRLEGSRCPYVQGRVVGGGSALNYMFNVRGNAKDYDKYAEMGNVGWSYKDVLPYLRMVENVTIPELKGSAFRGYDGPTVTSYPPHRTLASEVLLQGLAEAGSPEVEYNAAQQTGSARIQTTMFRGFRWSASTGYLGPARRRPNLFVRRGSTAMRVLLDGRGRAVGVRYRRGDEDYEAFANKEVILSGGTINSPALLLRSGIGPREHLQSLGIPLVQDLPVGRNLIDHTGFPWFLIALNRPLAPTITEIITNPVTFADYIARKRGPLSMTGPVEVLSFLDLNGTEYHDPAWPPVEVLWGSLSPVFNYEAFAVLGVTKDTYNRFFLPLKDRPLMSATVLRLRPRSRGTVTLASADPAVPPLVDPRGLSDPEDAAVTLAGIRALQKMLPQMRALQQYGARMVARPVPGCELEIFDSDGYWKCALRSYSQSNYHPCCTCKMAPESDKTGVVTPDLKVKGVPGLRVVDFSVLPDMVTGHPMMNVYMIAEKAADMIKAEYRE